MQDAAGLEAGVAELLADPRRAVEMGHKALEVVHENQGSIDRTVDMIVGGLRETARVYVAARRQEGNVGAAQ